MDREGWDSAPFTLPAVASNEVNKRRSVIGSRGMGEMYDFAKLYPVLETLEGIVL